jgi:hypothetical protein
MIGYIPLYFLVGGVLTFYWERDNDGLIGLEPFEIIGWPLFLVLYTCVWIVNKMGKEER